ncbi:MAG: hypothetical protein L3J16_00015 [Anaerolineales bacterium]|nr:hypothetical protein [Anaerolineales bacterium]
MTDTTPDRREAFIIRLWQEQTYPTRWRGEIQHVRSGETTSIQNLGKIVASIVAYLDSESESQETLK